MHAKTDKNSQQQHLFIFMQKFHVHWILLKELKLHNSYFEKKNLHRRCDKKFNVKWSQLVSVKTNWEILLSLKVTIQYRLGIVWRNMSLFKEKSVCCFRYKRLVLSRALACRVISESCIEYVVGHWCKKNWGIYHSNDGVNPHYCFETISYI